MRKSGLADEEDRIPNEKETFLAKVSRDREMIELDKEFPGYGLAQHKGYPTKAHLESLNRLGVHYLYRKSFKPVKALLG